MHGQRLLLFLLFVAGTTAATAQELVPLPGTSPFTNRGDLSAQMVDGIGRWLMRETDRVAAERRERWDARLSRNVDQAFLSAMRERLATMIGAVDERVAMPELQLVQRYAPLTPDAARTRAPFFNPATNGFVAHRVRWPVFENVFGEGLLLDPIDADGKFRQPLATIIVIPDADQTPEMLAGLEPGISPPSQFARHLVESRWQVLIPVLVSRDDQFSGSARLNRFTNQPHREWIYRQAYELGRHVIGFEVQKVRAALSAFSVRSVGPQFAVAGYGEGGLIALHAAALDGRIDAVLVSGYFGPREQLWREPIYRNLFGFVREFGDAELAGLIAPRRVVVEHSETPRVAGPPTARPGRSGAAPGTIATPDFGDVEAEVERANQLAAAWGAKTGSTRSEPVELIHGSEGMAVQFGSRKALTALAAGMGITNPIVFGSPWRTDGNRAAAGRTNRQERAVRELESFTQTLFRHSERVRDQRIWSLLSDSNAFFAAAITNREFFWRDVIGKIDATKLPPNARTRRIYEKEKWTGYEVVLDVFPDVFAWGYLLVPKGIEPGERRPVVVCQHGLEGVPEDTVTEETKSRAYGAYRAFAARLAERGFIVYAPHNPYRGQDAFRVLQRKANPLGLSLFSFIIAQHEVTTEWLASLPFVDPERIAFYGLSYGGKTAMRVPAVIDRYCLSICSADFNEWVQKNVTVDAPYSYLFTGEYEMPEWNLGHTFNYAEMASLIAPRPFMVERGHDDGVAPDPWVAYEFAKVRRMYVKLGIAGRTGIEFFDGPHAIHGAGTFKFLHQHLNWPEP